REQHYGDWEGRSYEEVQAGTPELYARLMSGDLRFAPPGGESIADLLNRTRQVEALLRPMAEDHAADTMVVAHAGSIRALAVTLLKLPRSTFWRLKVSPASLSVISLYADGATVDLWNDTCHLEAAGER
ncbi:MAG: histidine phosphatase family protein, partial [Chloroflexi bacterium]|nr:histidine phosphatase family protein [Chloroflexota bacterium]